MVTWIAVGLMSDYCDSLPQYTEPAQVRQMQAIPFKFVCIGIQIVKHFLTLRVNKETDAVVDSGGGAGMAIEVLTTKVEAS